MNDSDDTKMQRILPLAPITPDGGQYVGLLES